MLANPLVTEPAGQDTQTEEPGFSAYELIGQGLQEVTLAEEK